MEDLTGRKYGRLTVLGYAGSYMWECVCDCGCVKNVRSGDLKLGRTKSCGCLRRQLLKEHKFVDLEGRTLGRLYVAERIYSQEGELMWRCVCSCGSEIVVKPHNLLSGDTKSCGCLKRDVVVKRNQTHGMSKTRLYHVWKGMIRRCENKNDASYPRYGGRGIEVCNEWRNDFSKFYEWAVQNGYDDQKDPRQCTIDRIDNDGGYCPENCRWITLKEQAVNRSDNHWITCNGQTLTISQWGEKNAIPPKIIEQRIRAGGWDPIDAITVGVGEKNRNRRPS